MLHLLIWLICSHRIVCYCLFHFKCQWFSKMQLLDMLLKMLSWPLGWRSAWRLKDLRTLKLLTFLILHLGVLDGLQKRIVVFFAGPRLNIHSWLLSSFLFFFRCDPVDWHLASMLTRFGCLQVLWEHDWLLFPLDNSVDFAAWFWASNPLGWTYASSINPFSCNPILPTSKVGIDSVEVCCYCGCCCS